tara:strand:- start:630 stop:1964 length:1335 start_codon:yes stop_codon:yes gene_type:complete
MIDDINHVLILGCGQTGLSIARYFKNYKKISFYDESESAVDNAKNLFGTEKNLYFSGDLEEKFFDGVDLVGISPGIDPRHPLIKIAKKKGIKFHNDISLFFEENDLKKTKVIAVTGTNGKTTVCSMIEQIILESGFKVKTVGNIGVPILDIGHINNLNVLIVELSSFQLEVLENAKIDVGVILNISDDHMDRYNSFIDYFQAKAKLFNLAEAKIVNRDDEGLFPLKDKATLSFGISKSKAEQDYTLTKINSESYIKIGCQASINITSLKLIGEHNKFNLMAAIACIKSILPKFDSFNINNLNGVDHRLELVRNKKGIFFYNDSKATNVNATITALKSFDKENIFLIAGGESKNQILKPLEKYLKKLVTSLYLIGQDADLFEKNFNTIDSLMISKHDSMKDAVLAAYKDAHAGDIILLSPACASYDMYKNYKERGDQYKSVVEEL